MPATPEQPRHRRPSPPESPTLNADQLIATAAARLGWGDEEVASTRLALERRLTDAGKTCARCGEHKPFAAFGSDASKPSGRYPACRRCRMRVRPKRTNS